MFQTISPFIWIVLQFAIVIVGVKVSAAIAKKTDIAPIAFIGMVLSAAFFCTSAFMSQEMLQERQSLSDDFKVYTIFLQAIPDKEGYKIDERLYDSILKHNDACQDAQNMILEHPVAMWFFSGGNIESYEQYMVTIPPHCLYAGAYEQYPPA